MSSGTQVVCSVTVPGNLEAAGVMGGQKLSGSARSLGGTRGSREAAQELLTQTFELRDAAGGLSGQPSHRLLFRWFSKGSLFCVLSLRGAQGLCILSRGRHRGSPSQIHLGASLFLLHIGFDFHVKRELGGSVMPFHRPRAGPLRL